MSLKARNLRYLIEWRKIDENHWVNGGELERKALELGFKASNCSRRLRELHEEGKIERRMNGKSVEYRAYSFL